jgi:hypothetical protein
MSVDEEQHIWADLGFFVLNGGVPEVAEQLNLSNISAWCTSCRTPFPLRPPADAHDQAKPMVTSYREDQGGPASHTSQHKRHIMLADGRAFCVSQEDKPPVLRGTG